MGDSAGSQADAASTCNVCGGRCELHQEVGKPCLRCTDCGQVIEVAIVPALGKWTVVDPEGVVRQFTNWHELIGSLPLSAAPLRFDAQGAPRLGRAASASSLLEVTPPPASARELKSERSLADAAEPLRLSLVPPDEPSAPSLADDGVDTPRMVPKARLVEATKDRLEDAASEVSEDDVEPASDEARAHALARAFVAKASSSKVSMAPPLPARASARPPSTPSVPPPPPAPRGGTLKTLPPSSRRDRSVPPPPTIDVESAAPRSKKSGRAAADTKPSARPHADADAEAAPRRWLLPAIGAGILALGVAYVLRTPASDPDAVSVAAPSAPSSPPAGSASPASASVPPSAPAPALAVSSAAPSSSASALSSAFAHAPTDHKPAGDSQLSLPELLERASVARKSGDASHAKSLLERALVVSPGNAEAYGLLGDLARSQGDSSGAKASYDKALVTSPSYFPALLGLADTEWDLGERDSAQRRYITILALGRPVPDRVKTRAIGGAATSAPATPAPASTASGEATESAPAAEP